MYVLDFSTSSARLQSADFRPCRVIGGAFESLQLRQRARVLRRLLTPVGPLALVVLAGGTFAKYVRQARSRRMVLAPEDVARVTPAQIVELACYAEQSEPSAVQEAMRITTRTLQSARRRTRGPRVGRSRLGSRTKASVAVPARV